MGYWQQDCIARVVENGKVAVVWRTRKVRQ
jgi:hypothetical protein